MFKIGNIARLLLFFLPGLLLFFGVWVGRAAGARAPAAPATCDQAVDYCWHTFWGGVDWDYVDTVAYDSQGNFYLFGDSESTWTGENGALPLNPHSGFGSNAVLVKLDAHGNYLWHTFINQGAYADGMVIDGNDDIYLVAFRTVLKLTSDGGYLWDVSLHDNLEPERIALDAAGNVYLAGHSWSGWNYQPETGDPIPPRHAYTGGADLTVVSLTASGGYRWHTFWPPYSEDGLGLVAFDGGVYIAGGSNTSWLGQTPQGAPVQPLHPFSGAPGSEIMALKLDASSGDYAWHTFYGASGASDWAVDIVQEGGNLYLTGSSEVAWLGDSGAAALHDHSGNFDAFVLRLSPSGGYGWHTFWGSADMDHGALIAANGAGDLFITGESGGTWLGQDGAEPRRTYQVFSGMQTVHLLKLRSDGAYVWHGFWSGFNDETGVSDLAADAQRRLYLAGGGYLFGPGVPEPLHPRNGSTGDDLMAVKLCDVEFFRAFLPYLVFQP